MLRFNLNFWTFFVFQFVLCSALSSQSNTRFLPNGMITVEQEVFDEHTEVVERLDAYLQQFHLDSIQEYLDFIHPALFEKIPRELLEKSIRSAFNTPGMDISFDTTAVLNVQGPMIHKNISYAKVDYAMTMFMQVESDEWDEQVDTSEYVDESKMEFMLEMLKMQMGEDNVALVAETNTIVLNPPSSLYAIKDQTLGDEWYFLDVNYDLQGFLDKVVPKQVQKKFE